MILAIVLGLALLLALAIALRPRLGDKPFAFVALFALPAVAALMGVNEQLERSHETRFCTSCHVMERYGRSLKVDDATLLAASHYQGGRVPRDRACFTCHTEYTMYGDLNAKLRGLRHVYVNYLGKAPAKLKLYTPYKNRECLHCHEGTRRYLGAQTHQEPADRFEKMGKDQVSCVNADCHGSVHAADEVDTLPLWEPRPGGKK